MDDHFLNPDNWKDIHRGHLYLASFFYPSSTERPLSFFKPTHSNSSYGRITISVGNFAPVKVKGKNKKSSLEQQVVVKMKPRRVLVLSSDKFNHSKQFDYVQVAPIMSIEPKDKKMPWYKQLIIDEHPTFVYLPKDITGQEAYIDMLELISIHKSSLLSKKEELPIDRMIIAEEILIDCLELGEEESEEKE